MTPTNEPPDAPGPEWPDNRYGKRLPLRLRRRTRLHPGWNKFACPPSAKKPNPGVPAGPPEGWISPQKLQEINERFKEQMQRMQSEFENFRRRTRKESEELRQTAASGVLETLLPVVDNFSRALKTPATSLEGFIEGVRMIQGHFGNLLREAGLERVDAEPGRPFDPKIHEAVAVDDTGQHPDNTIAEVLQEGYQLKGKLLRPAMVKVSRH